MKTISLNDVIVVAADLMVKNGQTTTLEVKNELRNNGFKAFQVEVSQLMDTAKSSENWDVNDNGIHRTYSVVLTKASTPATTTAPVVKAAKPTRAAFLGTSGDWEVNSVTDSQVLYFGSHLTRDEVRRAYAKAVGVLFVDTRSRKVK